MRNITAATMSETELRNKWNKSDLSPTLGWQRQLWGEPAVCGRWKQV